MRNLESHTYGTLEVMSCVYWTFINGTKPNFTSSQAWLGYAFEIYNWLNKMQLVWLSFTLGINKQVFTGFQTPSQMDKGCLYRDG